MVAVLLSDFYDIVMDLEQFRNSVKTDSGFGYQMEKLGGTPRLELI